jgi:hypothetical protein
MTPHVILNTEYRYVLLPFNGTIMMTRDPKQILEGDSNNRKLLLLRTNFPMRTH